MDDNQTTENPFADLTVEQLDALFTEKQAAINAIKAAAKPTLSQVKEAEKLHAELASITEAKASFAALSNLGTFAEEDPEPEPEPEEDPADKAEADPVTEPVEAATKAGGSEADPKAEKDADPAVTPDVVPSGTTAPAAAGEEAPQVEAATGTVATLAAKTGRPVIPEDKRRGHVKLRAASGLDTFSGGQVLDDLSAVAKGVLERARSFPDFVPASQEVHDAGPQLQKFSTATVDLDFPEEFVIDDKRMTPEMIEDVLNKVSDETQLPGNSLTASSNGWCAPSDVLLDLSQDATTEGLLSHPEVGIARAGLKWPQALNFADFYANPGFKYTEAQAMAGDWNGAGGGAKPCITIPCPDFDEARLSIEGLCIKVDILQNAGWPETVRNFIDGTMVAHAHWMNATKIGAMVTIAGAARVITGMGSSVDDTLAALELVGNQTRQKYRLRFNQTLEVVLPFWVLDMLKADIRRRNGDSQLKPISDEQVKALFRAAKMNVQFVYDWQGIDETAEVYPATFNALVYPAGTFIFGAKPVINLSTVYDAASLGQNEYTGLFTEQGWLVAQRKFNADLLTLPIANAGARGPLNFATGAGKL